MGLLSSFFGQGFKRDRSMRVTGSVMNANGDFATIYDDNGKVVETIADIGGSVIKLNGDGKVTGSGFYNNEGDVLTMFNYENDKVTRHRDFGDFSASRDIGSVFAEDFYVSDSDCSCGYEDSEDDYEDEYDYDYEDDDYYD